MNTRFFPSKVLLFGEYTLLFGSPAVAVPFHKKGGKWAFLKEKDEDKQQNLPEFAKSEVLESFDFFDSAAFIGDVKKGLYFDSTIPMGYGLGSSGALVAAAYDRYVTHKLTDPESLKEILAQMEGFFHGNSSGIDPLTSYMDSMIFYDKMETAALPSTPISIGKWRPYLLDTKMPRHSAPLIEWFEEEMSRPTFAVAVQNIGLYSHSLINVLLTDRKNEASFVEKLEWLSNLQYNFMHHLIPEKYWEDWALGLESKQFFMKLCGAGGGGFILVWMPDGYYGAKHWDLTPL